MHETELATAACRRSFHLGVPRVQDMAKAGVARRSRRPVLVSVETVVHQCRPVYAIAMTSICVVFWNQRGGWIFLLLVGGKQWR